MEKKLGKSKKVDMSLQFVQKLEKIPQVFIDGEWIVVLTMLFGMIRRAN